MDNQDWKERHSYHKVSHPEGKPPNTKNKNKHLLFLTLPIIIAVLFLYGNMNPPPSTADSSSQGAIILPDKSEIHPLIDNIGRGVWGQETIDMLDALIAVYNEQERTEVVQFLNMLKNGDGADAATDEFLESVAKKIGGVTENGVPESEKARYRLALEKAKQAVAANANALPPQG